MRENLGPGNPKGRPKGSPNKVTVRVLETLDRLNCDPIEGMARIALGDVPCPTCDGKGCGEPTRACDGKGKERIPVELRAKMFSELAPYAFPKRKSVEVTGSEGGPVEVVMHKAEQLAALLDE